MKKKEKFSKYFNQHNEYEIGLAKFSKFPQCALEAGAAMWLFYYCGSVNIWVSVTICYSLLLLLLLFHVKRHATRKKLELFFHLTLILSARGASIPFNAQHYLLQNINLPKKKISQMATYVASSCELNHRTYNMTYDEPWYDIRYDTIGKAIIFSNDTETSTHPWKKLWLPPIISGVKI